MNIGLLILSFIALWVCGPVQRDWLDVYRNNQYAALLLERAYGEVAFSALTVCILYVVFGRMGRLIEKTAARLRGRKEDAKHRDASS